MEDTIFKGLIRCFAMIAFAVGSVGCVLCLPYAISTNVYWISIAGVYFVAGGIMIVGSLITLSLMTNNATKTA